MTEQTTREAPGRQTDLEHTRGGDRAQAQVEDPGQESIQSLPGIGPARAKLFAKLGVRTVGELAAYLPRTYEDRTRLVTIGELEPGVPACFEAYVVSQPRTARIRKGLELTQVRVADDSHRLQVTYFNQSYSAGALQPGKAYIFYGALSEDGGHTMTNPVFEPKEEPGTQTRRLLPVYPQTAGLNNNQIVKGVARAMERLAGRFPELLPQEVRQTWDLMEAEAAWQAVHDPQDWATLARAQRRLVFEEFFVFSAGLWQQRNQRRAQTAWQVTDLDLGPFTAALPFTLTRAQQTAIADVARDLGRDTPMSRLIQGDVGSGKTMVAAAAAYLAAKNGLQAAIMAPTELLARQEYETLSPLLEGLGISTELLTGSMTTAQRRRVLDRLELGLTGLVVGTHALLSQGVAFQKLGLVIVDEQHRFGTAQRGALAAKGPAPHVLVMSATPIPRTLALLLYGELDVSVMDEKPTGRQEVQTFLVGESYRKRINAFIRKQVEAGHQAFVICPTVEQSDQEDLKSAQAWAEALQTLVFPDLRVALLHGRLPAGEKQRVMAAFAAGEQDILVATTVVEVGVDVPNATLMVIENAERFGLSQLHQLRGRVGRGTDQSYCVLFAADPAPDTLKRLRAFTKTTDGFAIAQADLELRGPGDFLGARQHGLPAFHVASLATDLDLLQHARDAAAGFLSRPDHTSDPAWGPLQDKLRQWDGLLALN